MTKAADQDVTDSSLLALSGPWIGLYALPTADPGYVALLQRRQLLTCLSAAPFYRLWTVDSAGPLHVYHRRGEAFDGQAGHSGLLLEPHPHRPVAALGDVLIHALRCLPFHESLVMVDCAVGRGDMTLDFLRQRLPGKRNGRARQVLDWVGPGAESMLETLARTYFRQAGVKVEAQVHLDGVGYVDLLLEGRLIVELDGRHHGEWAQIKKDQRRNNLSVVQGYAVLRYYYDDVVHHPGRMVAEVMAVLAGSDLPG
ncbi:DUF559 domain-containing protein [Arthrobacter sp. UYEF20]|uniref:endonuclease domain-containing protein n=1 Tax=Arthrobacter sp. UYEF20 TaxID=1756363 RepID=UPI003395CE99